MIGCLIFGSLAAMGIARAVHHRRFYGGGLLAAAGMATGTGMAGTAGGPDPRERLGRVRPRGPRRVPFAVRRRRFSWPGRVRRGAPGGRQAVLRAPDPGARAGHPAQERVIGAAVEEFRDELKKNVGGEGRRTRKEIVEALRHSTFDGVLLGEQFARHDTILENGRKSFVGLVAKIHDALEPEQRERLADLLEGGPASIGCAGAGNSATLGKIYGCGVAGPLHRRRRPPVRAAGGLPRAERRDAGARRRRREGAGGARGGRLRRGAARRDDAGDGRPHGLPAHPRDQPRADHHADRARRRGRSGGRARARRRRLRPEAVLAARAPGPAAGGDAAGAAGGRRRARSSSGRAGDRRRRAPGARRRRAGRSDRARVRHPGRAGAAAGPGGPARDAARGGGAPGRHGRATGPSTSTSRTCAASWATIPRRRASSRPCGASATCCRSRRHATSAAPREARPAPRCGGPGWPPLARPLGLLGRARSGDARADRGRDPERLRPAVRAPPSLGPRFSRGDRAAPGAGTTASAGSCGCTTARTCTGGCSSGSARRSFSPSSRPRRRRTSGTAGWRPTRCARCFSSARRRWCSGWRPGGWRGGSRSRSTS